ncbi:hypothetical protein AMATHDRAFT_55621 [Amanita thiersii Skay4041]|uniref:Uncharacterized protein n=1 Tax=Amanita thiersii Skay4041 TaxID=703135 RepID=A0A2A9NXJ4_9AGAR|nr:hypothetical protein AMATHDRAFT_55621 [Amanita thiersii Skay4041]
MCCQVSQFPITFAPPLLYRCRQMEDQVHMFGAMIQGCKFKYLNPSWQNARRG